MMRQKHLSPELTRLEKSLKARAARLCERATAMPPGPEANVLMAIAAEFTELAEELHQP